MTTYTKKQLKANRKLWVDALRSNKYPQTKEVLQSKEGFCCLGVLCEIASQNNVEVRRTLTNRLVGDTLRNQPLVANFVGLKSKTGRFTQKSREGYKLIQFLTALNDKGTSFEEIADIIESNPSELFYEL